MPSYKADVLVTTVYSMYRSNPIHNDLTSQMYHYPMKIAMFMFSLILNMEELTAKPKIKELVKMMAAIERQE